MTHRSGLNGMSWAMTRAFIIDKMKKRGMPHEDCPEDGWRLLHLVVQEAHKLGAAEMMARYAKPEAPETHIRITPDV